jgi:hypothetical protein
VEPIDPYDLSDEAMRERFRRAQADPPTALCGYCGWSGPAPNWGMGPMIIGTETSTGRQREIAAIAGAVYSCPRCGRERAEIEPGIWRGFGEAVREADLTAEELAAFGEYLAAAPPSLTPEDAEAAHPALAPLIRMIADLRPAEWIALAGVVVAILMPYLQPSPDAKVVVVERSSELDDRDLMRTVKRLAHAADRLERENESSTGQTGTHDQAGNRDVEPEAGDDDEEANDGDGQAPPRPPGQ